MERAWIITRKEWAEVFKNRIVIFTVAFLPVILTALPLVILQQTTVSGEFGDLAAEDMPPSFEAQCEGLSGGECMQFFIVSQFMLLFLIMPLAIPVTIASYSIIGEKTRRTLEPLLATPVTTAELLGGKSLAAMLPAVGISYAAYFVFVGGSVLLGVPSAVVDKLLDPTWLIAVLIVGPLLALAAVAVVVMVSSRANDPRVAEQLSMLVILPLLALFFGQIAGLILINEQLVLVMAAALAAIDALLLVFAVQLFQRETILTRWK